MTLRPLLILTATAVLAASAAAQEQVYLRRFADSVAVRIGELGHERMLYYFSPTAYLSVGDELEQEGGAHSEVLLSAGGRVELTGPAHMSVEALDGAGDTLRFTTLSRLAVVAGDRVLNLELPGGIRCEMQETRIDMHIELGRLRIRNTGALPVTIHGMVDLESKPARAQAEGADGVAEITAFEIGRGEEVRIPYFGDVDEVKGRMRTRWNRKAIWHDKRSTVEAQGDRVRVGTQDTGAELSLAGVATRLPPNSGLVVTDRSRRMGGANAEDDKGR